MSISYESDWKARCRSRLYVQFRKPKFQAWSDIIARQFQDLEDALQGLATIADIDGSVGAQLDVLGRIVGQPRVGLDDDTYRVYIRARIVARRSDGSGEALYKVFRQLLGSIGFSLRQGWVKSFALTVRGTLTDAQALAAGDFLHDSKEAGARAILEFTTVPDDNLLRFNVAGHGFGATSLGSAWQV